MRNAHEIPPRNIREGLSHASGAGSAIRRTRARPDLHDRMIAARRLLHANPELSNDEHETQACIRRWLKDRGVGDARPVAGTGVFIDIVGK